MLTIGLQPDLWYTQRPCELAINLLCYRCALIGHQILIGLYPVKHSSNVNAFIKHISNKCAKLKMSHAVNFLLLWWFFSPSLRGYVFRWTGPDHHCGDSRQWCFHSLSSTFRLPNFILHLPSYSTTHVYEICFHVVMFYWLIHTSLLCCWSCCLFVF